ncbi:S-adenosyl-L-methionine-dependent methyltransferase [Periconia macrospinosa]|uniref:S-adenosyl-L-methionine-dependent methyltransferase n=1 Tax=Periconia macrospinosa TaxID=97972 RepID=A0A2V1DEH9_9PLEO|nr:S-adenosyl-L-methionine-dependent methyltransferase [Periconia macrospinosa]
MAPSRIVELASSIEQNTRKVDDYFAANALPSPSFDPSTPPDLPLPPDIAQAKEAVLEAMDELQALLLGPMPKIFHDLIHTPTSLTSLHAIARFKWANSFGPTETTTTSKLAETAGLHKADVDRLVRHAISSRLLLEPSPGVIAHSAMSNTISNVPLLREWIEETCENMWSSAPRIVPAVEKWPGSEEPTETAWNLAHHTSENFFVSLGKDEAKAKRFADSMSFFQSAPDMQTSLVIDNYDWSKYKTIVDVGGSHGLVALELVKRFPEITATVQDLPEVISAAPTSVEPRERVTFQAYNFFTEQPVKDADVYLFRMIFHNWGDKYCLQILQNLIPALKKGAKIVINDHVVPEPGVLSLYKDRSVRAFDLVMKQCFNAKERSISDWTALLKKVDERFDIVEVKRPQGSQLQIIDVVWK